MSKIAEYGRGLGIEPRKVPQIISGLSKRAYIKKLLVVDLQARFLNDGAFTPALMSREERQAGS